MERVIRSVFFTLLTFVWTSPALAETRRAFVVGINQYDNFSTERQLQNAVSDADAMAKAFVDIKFDQVVPRFDLKRSKFISEWQNFLNSIQEGDTVAFYFSGHGVQIDGKNYLLPRSMPYIQYGRSEQIRSESLSVNGLLLDIQAREPQVTIIILDACRNDPLIPEEYRKGIAGKGGLAKQISDPPEGTFIMYAAAAGKTALDRLPKDSNQNSVYTRHLLELLPRQDLDIYDMARLLRTTVSNTTEAATGYKQRPSFYGDIDGEFCLPGCAGDEPSFVPKTKKASDIDSFIATVTRDTQGPNLCTDTPAGVQVDANGCPLDRDSDGVANDQDQCPDSKAGAIIDTDGCDITLKEKGEVRFYVKFGLDSATSRDDHNLEVKKVADFMRQHPHSEVQVEGYTDSSGAHSYNKMLSARRAAAIAQMLVDVFEIDSTRVRSIGYGEERPVADNSTAAGRQENRRVVAVVTAREERSEE